MLKDCPKGFNRGAGKVIPPEQTVKTVLRKVSDMESPILQGYYKVRRPSRIPQYAFVGTEYYRRTVGNIMFYPKIAIANGKGHCDEQAKASGLMEMVERYSCARYLSSYGKTAHLYSFKDLKKNLFQKEDLYADLTGEKQKRVLMDSGLERSKIPWYRGYTLSGRKVYLPVTLIIYLLEGTNGMAAGNSLEEALLHAVCEVIERHCLSLIESKKLRTPRIDPSTVDSPIARKLIKRFQLLKHRVYIKDFSLGIGVPVIGVVRIADKENYIVTAGVATNREEALIRALTESSQGEGKETLKNADRFKQYSMHDGMISFQDVVNIDDINMKVELENVGAALRKRNMKVFYVDTTDKVLNIPSVIAYISGAKTIYYHKEITRKNTLKLLINLCLDTENYGDLENYLKNGVKRKYIERSDVFYLRGLVLKRRAEYKKAIGYLSRAAAGSVGLRVKSYVNIGLCYQAMRDVNSAADYYSKVADLDPDFKIEDLQFYYDNVRSLSNERAVFENAKRLYRRIKLLRARS
jgi:ribosomal protein S12 methylthiotransferase accessory factor